MGCNVQVQVLVLWEMLKLRYKLRRTSVKRGGQRLYHRGLRFQYWKMRELWRGTKQHDLNEILGIVKKIEAGMGGTS